MTTTASPKLCVETRKDGQPCHAYACAGSDYCFVHDPAKAAERKAARTKGGRARHGRKVGVAEFLGHRQFRSMADMTALLEIAVQQTLRLENSVSRNRCLGYLARCWADLHEAGELEERLAALERIMDK